MAQRSEGSAEQREPGLPLTVGFGVTRDQLWRAFGGEKAVRAAWALTLLAEHRLLLLSKRSVRSEVVGLERAPVEDKSVTGNQFLKNILPLYVFISWELRESYSMLKERLKYIVEFDERRKLENFFAEVLDPIRRGEDIAVGLIEFLAKRKAVWVDHLKGPAEFLEYDTNVSDKALSEVKSLVMSAKAMFDEYYNVDPSSLPVRVPPPERSFSTVVAVADLYDKYVGPRTKMYEIVRFVKTRAGELRVPDYAEVEREADDLLKRLAPLGAKVEYVLSSLALNGYRKGIAEQLEVPEEEREHLERLLDEPFRRVAILVAYKRVGNLRRLIHRLSKEAFTVRTAVPAAYIEAKPDVRRVLG